MNLNKVNSLSQIPTLILEKYIQENIHQTSSKTGKPIKVNTWHQPKSFLTYVIEKAGAENECLTWFKQFQVFENINKLTLLLAAQCDGFLDDELGIQTPTLSNKSKHTIVLLPSFQFKDCFFILIDNSYFLEDEHNIVKTIIDGDELVLTDVIEWD